MGNDFWYSIDDGSDTFGDPEMYHHREERLEKNATHSNWEILRHLQQLYYAGTGSKQEILELQKQLRQLIAKGLPYSYIEDYLIRMGYQLKTIKTVFRALTGLDAAVYGGRGMAALDTPGSIPGINEGWGKSKSKEHDYYFIMPWNLGWAVFGQKGELTRDEVEMFNTLNEARTFLEKKVKTAFYYDPPLSEDIIKHDISTADFGHTNPHGVRTAAGLKAALDAGEITPKQFAEQAREAGLLETDPFVAALVSQASDSLTEQCNQCELGAHERCASGPCGCWCRKEKKPSAKKSLPKKANPDVAVIGTDGQIDVKNLVQDEVSKLEQQLSGIPVVRRTDEDESPVDLLHAESPEVSAAEAPLVLKKILQKLEEWNASLHDFKLELREIKYRLIPLDSRIEQNVPLDTQKAIEYFRSSGVVTLLIEVMAQRVDPTVGNRKKGVIAVSVIGDDLVVNALLTGVDEREYALTDEGLAKYFQKELEESAS